MKTIDNFMTNFILTAAVFMIDDKNNTLHDKLLTTSKENPTLNAYLTPYRNENCISRLPSKTASLPFKGLYRFSRRCQS
jgi:hypothetical protein